MNIFFPFGWGELWGIADRTNYDLSRHAEHSGESMEYFDPDTNEKYIPYVIEPSLGADRVALAFLIDAYDEEQLDEEGKDVRTVLHLHPALAPFKAAVLPLSKKLSAAAGEVYSELSKYFNVDFDETVLSENVIAGKTRSEHLSALHMILILSLTDVLPSEIGTL